MQRFQATHGVILSATPPGSAIGSRPTVVPDRPRRVDFPPSRTGITSLFLHPARGHIEPLSCASSSDLKESFRYRSLIEQKRKAGLIRNRSTTSSRVRMVSFGFTR